MRWANYDSDNYQEYRPFMTQVGVDRIPCTVWLDRAEKVAEHRQGKATAEELGRITDQVLARNQ